MNEGPDSNSASASSQEDDIFWIPDQDQLGSDIRLKHFFKLDDTPFWMNPMLFVMVWAGLLGAKEMACDEIFDKKDRVALKNELKLLFGKSIQETREEIRAALKSKGTPLAMISSESYQVIVAIFKLMTHFSMEISSIIRELKNHERESGPVGEGSATLNITELYSEFGADSSVFTF